MILNTAAITEIIHNKRISMHFQPIYSISRQVIVGVEALCRGLEPEDILQPEQLFSAAAQDGLTVQLDRICRRKALESYAKLPKRDNLALFVNFEASIIDQGVAGSGHLLNCVQEFGLDPSHIVIEIIESKVKDIQSLLLFVEAYRSQGFLIALDDVGSGYSNVDRIAQIKPDIIKVDQYIVRDIDHLYYKQEILKSLVGLSRKLGTIVVAEGVERKEEAIVSLNMGANLLQGYYLGKPQPAEGLDDSQMGSNCYEVAKQFKNFKLETVRHERMQQRQYMAIVDSLAKQLHRRSIADSSASLQELVDTSPLLECMYLLNERGVQMSDTVFHRGRGPRSGRQIFQPASPGQDHSVKDYFYLLTGNDAEVHITSPYLSWASGTLCVTASTVIQDDCGRNIILCLDLVCTE